MNGDVGRPLIQVLSPSHYHRGTIIESTAPIEADDGLSGFKVNHFLN